MIKIVGIDPGLAATGIGVVSGRGHRIEGYSFGCITTSSSTPLAQRLDRIFTRLRQLFASEPPDLVVVEAVFSLNEYPKSGISLGQVSGAVHAGGFPCRAGLDQVPVREAKQILTGNGNATKVQLEMAVRRRLEHADPIRPFHASDALGLAIIGLFVRGAHAPVGPGLSPPGCGRKPAAALHLAKNRRTAKERDPVIGYISRQNSQKEDRSFLLANQVGYEVSGPGHGHGVPGREKSSAMNWPCTFSTSRPSDSPNRS